LWARFLLAGQFASEVRPDGTTQWFSQIAYGISPIVEGYVALAAATNDRNYAVLAGLTAAWFLGANPSGVVMYDAKTGRTFDGIDGPAKVNRNSGAESTIESLLALQSVTRNADAVEFMWYKPVGARSTSLANVPAQREFIGPGGSRVVLQRQNGALRVLERHAEKAPITLTYWPAANPPEVKLAKILAEQWNRENPDVQVRVQPLPAGRSTEEVLLAAIVAPRHPHASSHAHSAVHARAA